MTFLEAVRTLRSGGTWADLGEALAIVMDSPQGTLLDIALGLKHGGVIAEQAALALYTGTGRPLPDDRSKLVTDIPTWNLWIIMAAGEHLAAGDDTGRRKFLPDLDRMIGEKCENASINDEPLVKVMKQQLAQYIRRELKYTERAVLILYYFENMTFKEIGMVMDLSESRVADMHQAILKRIREDFGAGTEPLSRLVRDLVA